MGTVKDQLRTDLVAAMRARDELAKTTLRMAIGAIQKAEVAGDTARDLSADEELALLTKEVASRRDSAAAYTDGGRPELAAKELAEIEILQRYLPQPLTADELSALITKHITAVAEQIGTQPTMKQMGQVMKAVTAEAAGRAQGQEIADRVKQALT